MRAEPRRDTAGVADRTQRRELGLLVEAVPRLRLERRRADAQHPLPVPDDRIGELLGTRRARAAHRGHDPAAARVQFFVRRTCRAQRELVDTIAREARMRVAVDEPWDGAEPAPVELDDVALQAAELAHGADARDEAALAQDERLLDRLDASEVRAAERGALTCRGGELREVADQEAAPPALAAHSSAARRRIGRSRSPRAAASSASAYPASA